MKLNNRGFSLVELAIALGLVALLVSVVSAGSGMMAKSRTHREMEAVNVIFTAAQNYLSAQNLTYSGISFDDLKTKGFLPQNFDPVKTNSFGGDYKISENTGDSTKVDIALGNIPETAGTELTNVFKSRAEATTYDKSGKVWTATF
ncbi:MAG: type II secretion system protein [Candidatus Omnitrophica bacterium]|nr:type II secretion system protein [Candidatus Omnitrophota bacterium]